MFTVLIAEKEHIDAIRKENKLFFEPFLKSKELAFCYWNPAGRTLSESVPELLDTVGRTNRWRAIIINNGSEETLKARNPFDVIDNSLFTELTPPPQQPDENESGLDWIAKWEAYYSDLTKAKDETYNNALKQPLQKLATWLCFRPEDYILNDVSEKQSVQDWAMQNIEKGELKSTTRLELLEREQYRCELRLKENLRREFVDNKYLNISYPAEVHCISTRTTENTFFDPEVYWNVPTDNEYSTFTDRNMYFDKMRFMVFDLLSKEHRNFRTDYIRFLATVLIIASNPMPASVMQARRLYTLETKTDDTPLCTLVTSYDRKLAATSEVIDNEMEKIRSEIPDQLTDKAAEALFCTPNDIPVLLDESCDQEKVFAKNDYGLSSDCPENEHHKWNLNYKNSQKELAYILKQQSRAVKKSVAQTHLASEVIDININRLTPLQIEDIRDYTNSSEDEMVNAIPPDFTDMSEYTKQLSEESEKVKKVIRRRMSRSTTLIVGAICLLIYGICFLPFFFSNNNPLTVSTAAIFAGSMVGALAVVLFISLFFLRHPLKKATKDYNDVMNHILNDIKSSLKNVSNYLSAACNVRRGYSVQNYAEENVDEFTRSLRIRKKHQDDIRKKRAYLVEEYGDYLEDKSYCDETMARPYEFDFDQRKEYDYPAPFLAGDMRQIEFLSSGNFVTVPSSYVQSILVRMEGIYER